MRRVRITNKRAYHHVMNRGLNGKRIFFDGQAKNHIIQLMRNLTNKNKIMMFMYCIIYNHYHIVLQLIENNLSRFIKELNGEYGSYYSKRNGGKSYVFQNRFKLTLIESDEYLRMAIIYTLLNSVKAGLEINPMN